MTKDKICYCFNYTAEDILNDFQENGKSTIMARIMNEKKMGSVIVNQQIPKEGDASQMFARW